MTREAQSIRLHNVGDTRVVEFHLEFEVVSPHAHTIFLFLVNTTHVSYYTMDPKCTNSLMTPKVFSPKATLYPTSQIILTFLGRLFGSYREFRYHRHKRVFVFACWILFHSFLVLLVAWLRLSVDNTSPYLSPCLAPSTGRLFYWHQRRESSWPTTSSWWGCTDGLGCPICHLRCRSESNFTFRICQATIWGLCPNPA
jgi:hypothetical protein